MALAMLNVFRLGWSALGMKLLIRADVHVGKSEFDVLHCQFGQLGVEVARLREIGALQGVLFTSFRGTDAMKSATNRPERFRHLFAAGDRFLAVSAAVRDRLVEIGCPAEKIDIHRSGVDLSVFSFRDAGELHSPVRLVSIGRLSPNKGIEYGLDAVRKLLDEGYRIEYRVVGDGPSREALAEIVRRLNIEAAVTFDGAVGTNRVVEVLADADILITPSITGPHGEQEGLPNALKEAMASGVPAIGTSIGGIPELIEHTVNGFLVPERDSVAIAECIKAIINDRDKMPDIVTRARKSIELEFDLKQLNADLEDAYRQAGSAT
jgi:colanic acid/amylovoran biosynthesis glycosyltransferase